MPATPQDTLRPRASESGFGLLDALFAMAILAILLALAIPQYQAVLKQAQASEVAQVFADRQRELEIYRAEHQSYGDGSVTSSACGVEMPEGRHFKFQCVTSHRRGADLEYRITAIPRVVLSAAPETMVTAALFAVDQDGQRSTRTFLRPAKELMLACLPMMGVGC